MKGMKKWIERNEMKGMKWKEWKKNLFLFTNYIVNENSHLHASDDFLGLFVYLLIFFSRKLCSLVKWFSGRCLVTCLVLFWNILSFSIAIAFPTSCAIKIPKFCKPKLASTDKAFDVVCPRSKHHTDTYLHQNGQLRVQASAPSEVVSTVLGYRQW